jgi:putative transposase
VFPLNESSFRIPLPDVGPGRDDENMAGRKRHSAEDIVRKLGRADELADEGKTGEEIAAELGVSAATLYNWRRAYGGMDTDAAKELGSCMSRTAGSSGCWPRPNWKRTPCASCPSINTTRVPMFFAYSRAPLKTRSS